MQGDYLRGNVDAIILRCLGSGEMYGIEICKAINQISEGTFDLKKPTLYSALKRLEQEKYVTVRTQESAIGGIRNYYNLTDAGREILTNKKYDWIYSKVLIDNLVLNTKKDTGNVSEVFQPEVMPAAQTVAITQTAAAGVMSEFTSALPNKLSPYEAAASSNVRVAVRDVSPVEQYAAVNRDYITVPLSSDVARESARKLTQEVNTTPPQPVQKAIQTPHQIAVDIAKVEKIDIYDRNEPSLLKPFVKHSRDRACGKFVLYNRLRLFCSVLVTIVLGAGLECAYLFAKKSYTMQEADFFKVGWVCVGVYLLANIVLYFSAPKRKQLVTRRNQGLIKRAILTACIGLSAISISVIAGLSKINSSDYMVFWLVPCIVGCVFILEGLAIISLRRVRFFLT